MDYVNEGVFRKAGWIIGLRFGKVQILSEIVEMDIFNVSYDDL